MAAPDNTYNSSTNLSLGQVPQVEDEALYTDLLDVHNAIETLLKSSDKNAIAVPVVANPSMLAQFADLIDRIGSGIGITVDDTGVTCDDTFMTCDRTET
jgi:hypothetical protein